ncbi:hypothetical protein A3860_14510 [Niastella vici]|uniref:Uncharacterized protein n=1 Tax=Niastella vici TaxID=1703345 RepID=A0A1V9G5F6_9BACT|nr:hypothetical protein A3860_14510 [Niastella vici]
MELENMNQYVHTLFLIEDLNDEIKRLTKEPDQYPLRKKLFLSSYHAFREDLKNQVVTYELSRTKQSS